MSRFRVNLNNNRQGLLDINPTTGGQFATSLQRSIYVPGPNRITKKLMDGEEFEGSNYWKRFAYPQMPLTEAFLIVVEDDGSIYSNIPSENTIPRVYNLTIAAESSYEDNVVEIENGHATFIQINNRGSVDVQIKINGSDAAIFDLAANESQNFNNGDISVRKLEFISVTTEEESDDAEIQIITSIRSDLID